MRDLCRISVVVGHTPSAEALDHLGPVLHALARVMALVRLHVEHAPKKAAVERDEVRVLLYAQLVVVRRQR